MHDLSTRKHLVKFPGAHKGMVSGLCYSGSSGERVLSCGVDKTVKLWDVRTSSDGDGSSEDMEARSEVCFELYLVV